MELKQAKEYQTIRLFAILGLMTLMIVLLFKVVLFAPPAADTLRLPAHNVDAPPYLNQDVIKVTPTSK